MVRRVLLQLICISALFEGISSTPHGWPNGRDHFPKKGPWERQASGKKKKATSRKSNVRATGTWISPEYEYFFEYPLPIGPVLEPKLFYQPEASGDAPIDYYEVEVKPTERQIYPHLGKTQMVAYNGHSPGPIFKMERGREAVVRFTNNGPYDMSVHVHGQYNRAPFDGWAADYANPGQYKDYYYPNSQNARTAWFHDHTEFTTGENAYRGQEGLYIITDEEERSLNLPKDRHDIPLAIAAKFYNEDGSLNFDTNNSAGLWGDVIQVNGQPWPYLEVEPRKYRLRMLNGAVSRAFNLYFGEDSVNEDGDYVVGNTEDLEFDVIGADAGLLSHPVKTKNLEITMGERYELIADFEGFAGKNLTLKNKGGMGEGPDYAATDMVMRIVVGEGVTDDTNNGPIPSTLRTIKPGPEQDEPNKSFGFERIDDHWVINGVGFTDIEHRILRRPERGRDEIWEFHNGEGRGGGTHPVHIHLVDFQILSRTGGRNQVRPYEGAGFKDVVWLNSGEKIRVVARYAPWNGVYMFHCHNLIHEDNDMMVGFNVTNLENWGYDDTTQFIDPMQEEYRPKDINEDDYTEEAIMDKIKWFYGTNPYNHGRVDEVYANLDESLEGS
ncbi:Cupredoxin [Sporormia fimetaria CBS 119925]|uniref:Cupredoxin n=1 Tax=Sporormia fimetaria CBS 119925 TaxID=1340428 RepID=A0A6A6VAZ4_9PLEO|nr:Cupredoxin [Sporormia fimetaria CBS 119925]